ncbi:bifunctional riboflavin kinase/FAD synthetase [Fictibacillus barbaricus]|uniref:Riboflavin biosynthesis protein n=1 Tax=Fictibacillus barbaricus TaxID=182136 RepID=A0ABS2ZGN3_9BACL|nr:bifunctional riboflavin kinase/FAD synthetase [Fictibacillus barbaricus]MBN3545801.1 bifunctional riboflavin kinase/FAD synthetase [Fictibacillus barbaricus]GGB56207.1 riboflavin biosynthesis protein [Fictibacillus barbaricus]
METIVMSHPHHYKQESLPPTILALGYFDGIHIGHQRVISTAVELAEKAGAVPAVMSFHPHPSVVLGRADQNWTYITPLEEKKKVLESMGVKRFYLVKFDHDFASLSSKEFVDQYIIGLNVQHVVTGFDFSYGKYGKGNVETLVKESNGQFAQTVIEKIEKDGQKISSTLIRQFLKEGRVQEIVPYLGRRYKLNGTVIHGDKRGRTIGFPTANLDTEEYSLPKVGVYAVEVSIDNERYFAMANVGYKPTFKEDQKKPSLEVHIFDFHKEIYGKTVSVTWLKRIRDEKKFSGIDELIQQLNTDKSKTLEIIQTMY